MSQQLNLLPAEKFGINPVLLALAIWAALVLGLLATRLPGADVFAFGSRVRHWPFGRGSKPYSDLDLAVWPADLSTPGNTSIDLALAALRADLEESALPWRVANQLAISPVP